MPDGPAAIDGSRAWNVARTAMLLAAGLLTAELMLRPSLALRVFWYAIVPALPMVLLAQPGLWRNVCPLSALGKIGGRVRTFASRRLGLRIVAGRLSRGRMAAANAVGMGLVLLLIPARRYLFDTNATALAAAIGIAGGTALILGVFFDRKAGYCNAICPMLPIERLYGHAPVIAVQNAHCPTCTLCTRGGCIDLSPAKSVNQIVGRARKNSAWLARPFGVWIGAFPGLVVGFFATSDVSMANAPAVHAAVLVFMAIAWALFAFAALMRGTPMRVALTASAAASATLFYWFSAIDIATAWGLGSVAVWTIRAGSVLGITLWLVRRVGPISVSARTPHRRAQLPVLNAG